MRGLLSFSWWGKKRDYIHQRVAKKNPTSPPLSVAQKHFCPLSLWHLGERLIYLEKFFQSEVNGRGRQRRAQVQLSSLAISGRTQKISHALQRATALSLKSRKTVNSFVPSDSILRRNIKRKQNSEKLNICVKRTVLTQSVACDKDQIIYKK